MAGRLGISDRTEPEPGRMLIINHRVARCCSEKLGYKTWNSPLRRARPPPRGGGAPPGGGGQKVPFSAQNPTKIWVINWHLNRGGWVSQSSPLLSWWSPSQIPKKAQKRLANALLALKLPYIKGASRLYDRSLALI